MRDRRCCRNLERPFEAARVNVLPRMPVLIAWPGKPVNNRLLGLFADLWRVQACAGCDCVTRSGADNLRCHVRWASLGLDGWVHRFRVVTLNCFCGRCHCFCLTSVWLLRWRRMRLTSFRNRVEERHACWVFLVVYEVGVVDSMSSCMAAPSLTSNKLSVGVYVSIDAQYKVLGLTFQVGSS